MVIERGHGEAAYAGEFRYLVPRRRIVDGRLRSRLQKYARAVAAQRVTSRPAVPVERTQKRAGTACPHRETRAAIDDDAPPIWTDSDPINAADRTERVEHCERWHLPKTHRAVVTRRRDRPFVRAQHQAGNAFFVAAQICDGPCRGDVPGDRFRIAAGGNYSRAVGRD